jgi:hypothetical protein
MRGVLLLAIALFGGQGPSLLTLELRVFLAADEVTGETRVTIHRAGERSVAVAQAQGHDGRHVFAVPAGIYDAQLVREKDGRVVNIRWAERLVVMPYPDEGGKHLEVVNFANGHGALQVKGAPRDPAPGVLLFAGGDRTRPAAQSVPRRDDDDYVLFVVPAGRYDVQVKTDGRSAWHADIDVPLDRTRLWVIPAAPAAAK